MNGKRNNIFRWDTRVCRTQWVGEGKAEARSYRNVFDGFREVDDLARECSGPSAHHYSKKRFDVAKGNIMSNASDIFGQSST